MSLIIVELFGSPAAGKTFVANQLQASLTRANINSLYVHEFIKDHAVRKLPITPEDQLWIAGNQFRIESSTYGKPPKYQVIITDSPVSLAGFYAYQYSGKDERFLELTNLVKHWQSMADLKYGNTRIKMRVPLHEKFFKPEGRFENDFAETQAVDNTLSWWIRWAFSAAAMTMIPADKEQWVADFTEVLKGELSKNAK